MIHPCAGYGYGRARSMEGENFTKIQEGNVKRKEKSKFRNRQKDDSFQKHIGAPSNSHTLINQKIFGLTYCFSLDQDIPQPCKSPCQHIESSQQCKQMMSWGPQSAPHHVVCVTGWPTSSNVCNALRQPLHLFANQPYHLCGCLTK